MTGSEHPTTTYPHDSLVTIELDKRFCRRTYDVGTPYPTPLLVLREGVYRLLSFPVLSRFERENIIVVRMGTSTAGAPD